MTIYPLRCLSIAGSDSGGGAGIQADLKVFHILGCYGSSVLTCLTAQNTKEVKSVFPISACFVAEQIDAVLGDIGADCIKLGMLLNSEIIDTIFDKLTYYKTKFNFKLVIDPVMISKSGAHLLETKALENFIEKLLPLADIITPNLPEASALLKRVITTQEDMLVAAKDLVTLGVRAVVMKGGHLEDSLNSNDLLYYKIINKEYIYWFNSKRIDTKNTHGTGCTFSAALCSYLAKNYNLKDSVTYAKEFITKALEEGKFYQLGQGYGPAKF